jgi:hypothetical protein
MHIFEPGDTLYVVSLDRELREWLVQSDGSLLPSEPIPAEDRAQDRPPLVCRVLGHRIGRWGVCRRCGGVVSST